MTHPDFQAAFEALRPILKKFESKLNVVADTKVKYYLDGAYDEKRKAPIFFGAVIIKKNYVSFHLMPLYCCPELQQTLSPALQKHKQGKACFNFKKADPALFKELAALTKNGFDRFKKAGLI